MRLELLKKVEIRGVTACAYKNALACVDANVAVSALPYGTGHAIVFDGEAHHGRLVAERYMARLLCVVSQHSEPVERSIDWPGGRMPCSPMSVVDFMLFLGSLMPKRDTVRGENAFVPVDGLARSLKPDLV